MLGKIQNYAVEGQRTTIEFEHGTGFLEVVSQWVIRFFCGEKEGVSWAVADKSGSQEKADFKVEKKVNGDETELLISTQKLTVRLFADFRADIYDKKGELLCRDYRGQRKVAKAGDTSEQSILELEGHEVKEGGKRYKIEVVKEVLGEESYYGLGDRTGFLDKKGYFYELWNTDNPMPQVDSFEKLYKCIPFMITRRQDFVYGVFFDNTYRSFWDFQKESTEYIFFGANEGILDYYFFGGDSMKEVLSAYLKLTGTTMRPQLWTLGYQQSRFGYETEKEIREVAEAMRANRIPCDVIHLDIDYMDGYRVFTWNQENYDNPQKLIADLEEQGFKVVTILDPGVKAERGYSVYDEGKKKGYFAVTKTGKIYVNQVWPGDAVYPDFGRSEVRTWWKKNMKFLLDLGVRGIWNDMNEPASFQGDIPDDVVFYQEEEKSCHGKIHNVYGHLMSQAVYEGLKEGDGRRPFVITRACYAGSQRYTTAWTGDNHSIWAHLQMAIPQMCNLSLSGMSFIGTDVGGFGSDTTPELLARWMQVGCFSPLFRNHSVKGSRHQEPWQFDEKTLEICKKYISLRYRLLPYFYDCFVEQEINAKPVMAPLVYYYEQDEQTTQINDECMIGEKLLIAPVVTQGSRRRMVYLPQGRWTDFWTGEVQEGNTWFIKDAPLDICPAYVKAGSLIPVYPVQQYVGEKEISELGLYVFEGEGEYLHCQDDGESFAYQEGAYNQYRFTINKKNRLTIELLHSGYEKSYESIRVYWKGKEVCVSLKSLTDNPKEKKVEVILQE